MRVSLGFFLGSYRHAAMLGAGNNLQAEFAAKTNFRSVVAVKSDALEHSKKIAFELRVPLRDGVAVTRGVGRPRCHGFIHGAHQSELLHGTRIDEILSIQLVALLVDTGEAFEKMAAVLVSSPFGEDDIDEFIDPRTLGARRVRLRNDNFAHQHNRGVLVRIERAERVSRLRMRLLKKSEELGRKRRGNRSSR